MIWHGAGRGSSKKELQKFDVILTRFVFLFASLSWLFLARFVSHHQCQPMLIVETPSRCSRLDSYGTLQSSYKKQVEGFKRSGQIIKEDSVAHSFKWHRVIVSS